MEQQNSPSNLRAKSCFIPLATKSVLELYNRMGCSGFASKYLQEKCPGLFRVLTMDPFYGGESLREELLFTTDNYSRFQTIRKALRRNLDECPEDMTGYPWSNFPALVALVCCSCAFSILNESEKKQLDKDLYMLREGLQEKAVEMFCDAGSARAFVTFQYTPATYGDLFFDPAKGSRGKKNVAIVDDKEEYGFRILYKPSPSNDVKMPPSPYVTAAAGPPAPAPAPAVAPGSVPAVAARPTLTESEKQYLLDWIDFGIRSTNAASPPATVSAPPIASPTGSPPHPGLKHFWTSPGEPLFNFCLQGHENDHTEGYTLGEVAEILLFGTLLNESTSRGFAGAKLVLTEEDYKGIALFAGGFFDRNDHFLCHQWNKIGDGPLHEFCGATQRVKHFQAHQAKLKKQTELEKAKKQKLDEEKDGTQTEENKEQQETEENKEEQESQSVAVQEEEEEREVAEQEKEEAVVEEDAGEDGVEGTEDEDSDSEESGDTGDLLAQAPPEKKPRGKAKAKAKRSAKKQVPNEDDKDNDGNEEEEKQVATAAAPPQRNFNLSKEQLRNKDAIDAGQSEKLNG